MDLAVEDRRRLFEVNFWGTVYGRGLRFPGFALVRAG